jgi:hypothetical protein
MDAILGFMAEMAGRLAGAMLDPLALIAGIGAPFIRTAQPWMTVGIAILYGLVGTAIAAQADVASGVAIAFNMEPRYIASKLAAVLILAGVTALIKRSLKRR